jgi:hypothetical protein
VVFNDKYNHDPDIYWFAIEYIYAYRTTSMVEDMMLKKDYLYINLIDGSQPVLDVSLPDSISYAGIHDIPGFVRGAKHNWGRSYSILFGMLAAVSYR